MSFLRCVSKLTRAIATSTHFANQFGGIVPLSACFNFSNLNRNHKTLHTFGSSGTLQNASSLPSENPQQHDPGLKSVHFVEESSPTSRQPISEATFDGTSSRVVLRVGTERYEFPAVWLRDNCQCERCFHRGSSSRVLNWELFDVDRVKVVQ
uniref:Gamma-butyrobetaine hydroxylase-like N-terminal domain-containing protein n=1 Tax=Anopheles culicifacies TaxID=139723 RepID=A0A182MIK2_9DIPT